MIIACVQSVGQEQAQGRQVSRGYGIPDAARPATMYKMCCQT
uniref:Uncharacterized protein n=1 Tax=Magnetospirillum gryphiswaldense TaxID=55518 RepID=A4U3B8_9PROT|nr:hypothetical protein MGR_0231 [Magnetospirillum gryphiswaldense MSR-1]